MEANERFCRSQSLLQVQLSKDTGISLGTSNVPLPYNSALETELVTYGSMGSVVQNIANNQVY